MSKTQILKKSVSPFEVVSQVLVVKYDCTSVSPSSEFEEKLLDMYPYIKPYFKGRTPGKVKIFRGEKGKNSPFVVGMFCQKSSGEPKKGDTQTQRGEWFGMCLKQLQRLKKLKELAFLNAVEGDVDFISKSELSVPITVVVEKSGDTSEEVEMESDGETKTSATEECVEECSSSDEDEPQEKSVTEEPIKEPLIEEEKDPYVPPSEFYKWVWDQLCLIPFFDSGVMYETFRRASPIFVPNELHGDEDAADEKKERPAAASSSISTEENSSEDGGGGGRFLPSPPREGKDWSTTFFTNYTKSNIPEGWEDFFDPLIKEDGLGDLNVFLKKEVEKSIIYPPLEEVYTAFDLCPPEDIKVIIIGQDPYHTEGAAMGLAFGHHDTRGKIQPSLRNIHKALRNDGYEVNEECGGDLGGWASEGVFLINTALTVRKGEAGSHARKSKMKGGPWTYFTNQLFRYLNETLDHVVVVMWGAKAHEYGSFFDDEKHHKITAPHPAASSYNPSNTEFFDHKPFSRANTQLKKWGMEEVFWDIFPFDEEEE